jgi:hypothetical protein
MIPMNSQELSFQTFFSDLIFHPGHAHPQDQKKCLIISIALGIFSLGVIPVLIGIGWGIREVVLWIKKSPLQEKINNVFQNNIHSTFSIERKGFQNSSGTHCFLASALQCLASVRHYLPADPSRFSNQETGKQILALLDKVLSGIEGTDQELSELKNKLSLNDMGDAREALTFLSGCLDIDQINIFENDWNLTSNPIWIDHENFNNYFKAEKLGMHTCKYPLADKTNQKLNFFILLRSDLPNSLAERKPVDTPQLIQVPVANELNNYNHYELVATTQSLGGHAIAYAKENGGWIEFNDDKISKVSSNKVEEDIKIHSMFLVYSRLQSNL